MHISYEIEFIEIEVDNENIVKLLASKDIEKITKSAFIAIKEAEINAMKCERDEILKINAQFASFLKENAITPYNDDLAAYLNHQITEEQEKNGLGSDNNKLIKALTENLARYNAEVKSFEEATLNSKSTCTLDNFQTLVSKLYSLPLNGPTIKSLMEGISLINAKYEPEAFSESKVTFKTKATAFFHWLGSRI